MSWLKKITNKLSLSSNKLKNSISKVLFNYKIDSDIIEEIEDILIQSDLGITLATQISNTLLKKKFNKKNNLTDVLKIIAYEIECSLKPLEKSITINTKYKPHIILFVGVNGTGKTTTIGKLGKIFKQNYNKKVMFVAGDTFRPAAIEQLKTWGNYSNIHTIYSNIGSNPSGLVFDSINQARKNNIEVLLIDTAGRLQNKTMLMNELTKIIRSIKKYDQDAPHNCILVLDATTGQNAFDQVNTFTNIAKVNGIIMTKLDGTAKGGILVSISNKYNLPIHYIGLGEKINHLSTFSAQSFSQALVGLNISHNN